MQQNPIMITEANRSLKVLETAHQLTLRAPPSPIKLYQPRFGPAIPDIVLSFHGERVTISRAELHSNWFSARIAVPC